MLLKEREALAQSQLPVLITKVGLQQFTANAVASSRVVDGSAQDLPPRAPPTAGTTVMPEWRDTRQDLRKRAPKKKKKYKHYSDNELAQLLQSTD